MPGWRNSVVPQIYDASEGITKIELQRESCPICGYPRFRKKKRETDGQTDRPTAQPTHGLTLL